jgi:hypothetical protein
MRLLKLGLKLIAGVVLSTALCLYVLVNYSVVRQELTYKGHWKDGPAERDTAYVQLDEYRWWVSLWSQQRGSGSVRIQTDKRALSIYFDAVSRVGDGRLAFYAYHNYDYGAGGLGPVDKMVDAWLTV